MVAIRIYGKKGTKQSVRDKKNQIIVWNVINEKSVHNENINYIQHIATDLMTFPVPAKADRVGNELVCLGLRFLARSITLVHRISYH